MNAHCLNELLSVLQACSTQDFASINAEQYSYLIESTCQCARKVEMYIQLHGVPIVISCQLKIDILRNAYAFLIKAYAKWQTTWLCNKVDRRVPTWLVSRCHSKKDT